MELKLFHGSTKIIEKPQFGLGKPWNDYGRGFYCTGEAELAKEWACASGMSGASSLSGYSNEYRLWTDGLSILNLTAKEYSILNWLAVLLENRTFNLRSEIGLQGRDFLLEHYSISYKKKDVIIGYRADDSYFAFANAFLNNTISMEQLSKAMKLGNLGEQVAIMSKEAFERLRFVEALPVDGQIYHAKYHLRDDKAREEYAKLTAKMDQKGTYLIDLIRGNRRN